VTDSASGSLDRSSTAGASAAPTRQRVRVRKDSGY
jgi:hypothetical protein